MADDKSVILLCAFTFFCGVSCELNLTEVPLSPFNGDSVNGDNGNGLTAAWVDRRDNKAKEFKKNALFPGTTYSPCITKGLNGTCVKTYLDVSQPKSYIYIQKNRAVEPLGVLAYRKDSVAVTKCYEYFEKLPYRCRGVGNVNLKKIWKEEQKCHQIQLSIALSVGGQNAERWEFPHMALLGYGDDVAIAQWLCGGSVINERFILTAGHCTSTRLLGNISFAALGLLKRTDPKNDWKIYKIKRIITHPEYKAPSKYHDIALLETENEIAFGKDLLPACLNTDPQFNHNGQAAGWGRLGHRQALADTLQVVNLQAFEESECAGIYHPHRHLEHGYDHEKQMCYGSHSQIIDTCEGDSGGPLQYNKDGVRCRFSIIGVTSYGKDCGILGSAGMYARVSHYVPWIESVVWPEETEAKRKKDNVWLAKWLNVS